MKALTWDNFILDGWGKEIYMLKRIGLIIFIICFTLVACNSKSADQEDVDSNSEAKENVNKSGMPIVEEPETFSMFTGKVAQNAKADWNDIFIWNEYEDMTNINLEWEEIDFDALDEQRNLALGGGDLPDIFFWSQLPNTDIYRYGQQGTFIELNDLIDEYAPNLSKLMEEDPSIRKAITFPDGSIYTMPPIVDEDFTSFLITSRPWFNQDWLDELDMEVPETTDEFYEFLKAVKELDPAGNGDTVPYGGTSIDELVQYLSGAFGVANKGVNNGPVDLHPEKDEVRFYASTDEYKALLEYTNKLFEEGLIEENIFTIEWDQFLATAADEHYASMVFYDPIDLFGEEVGKAYESGTALEGPFGDQLFVKAFSTVTTAGSFAITKENPNPAAAVRWMDYFYSDEGAKFYFMGVEGETYEENEDGELEYMDRIKNPPEDSTFEQELAKELTWIGAEIGLIKEDYFNGSEVAPTSLEAADKIAPQVPEEIWPAFTYTEEENNTLNSIGQDIDKYVEEMRDKFIAGDVDFSEWDDYVEQIDKMGLDEYMEIKQTAYERYQDY